MPSDFSFNKTPEKVFNQKNVYFIESVERKKFFLYQKRCLYIFNTKNISRESCLRSGAEKSKRPLS